MPRVSVIVPVYKVEPYISNTVQSVLNQTYADFELLLVDDGSPDRSLNVCSQFNDPRIRILRQENRGASAARNHGMREATGEFFAFLDGDDLWLPEKLEKHIAHLDANPKVGLSFSRSAFIDEAGNPLGIYQMPRLTGIDKAHLLCRNPIGNGSTPVIRREVFEAIKFRDNLRGQEEDFYWDERLQGSQDVDCWMRIAILTDWEIEGIPEALTLYRVNSGGISANLNRHYQSRLHLFSKLSALDPILFREWGDPAMAYYLRYLSRRAVTLRSPQQAIQLFNRAMKTHWRMVLEEPRRTLLTGAAAYLLQVLPESLYRKLENTGMKVTGATQSRQISFTR